jgi:NADH:ubiquinone oxidoreductase subunit
MGILSFLGPLSPVHIWLLKLTGGTTYVGTDEAGNRYFEGRPIKGYKRPRRLVFYKGTPDASKVPPEWHGWLHHQTNVVPAADHKSFRRPWQLPHLSNQTGTSQAYMPQGHLLKTGQRPQATGDYQAWTPEQ